MKQLLTILIIASFIACHEEKVLYEELTPAEFTARLSACPVAYLPLGTLEWHGEHLPLGSDGLQSEEFFKILAQEAGGIVLPKLFIGPDGFDTLINGNEFYGMDCAALFGGENYPYEIQQLAGSAYWVPDSTFDNMMNGIFKQLSRAGFKIVVAHGHGPSTNYIGSHAEKYKELYNLTVMNCWQNDSAELCLMCDHAAANETSIMMYVRPELVQLKNLAQDSAIWPKGIMGHDPRKHANKAFGKRIIDFEVKKMSRQITNELEKIK